ncbi:MAG: hypothetical protein ACYC7E_01065 [Armatimonadota bacterium]
MIVRCPNCKVQGSTDDSFTGRTVKCSQCGTAFVLTPYTEDSLQATIPSNTSASSDNQQTVTEIQRTNDHSDEQSIPVFCAQCGTDIPTRAIYCQQCGSPVQEAKGNVPEGSNLPNAYSPQVINASSNEVKGSSANRFLGISSIVLGALGFCTVGVSAIIGLIFGLIVLKSRDNNESDRKAALIGTSISGSFLFILIVVFAIGYFINNRIVGKWEIVAAESGISLGDRGDIIEFNSKGKLITNGHDLDYSLDGNSRIRIGVGSFTQTYVYKLSGDTITLISALGSSKPIILTKYRKLNVSSSNIIGIWEGNNNQYSTEYFNRVLFDEKCIPWDRCFSQDYQGRVLRSFDCRMKLEPTGNIQLNLKDNNTWGVYVSYTSVIDTSTYELTHDIITIVIMGKIHVELTNPSWAKHYGFASKDFPFKSVRKYMISNLTKQTMTLRNDSGRDYKLYRAQ